MSSPEGELPSLDQLKQKIAAQKHRACPKAQAEEKRGRSSSKYAGVDFIVNVGTGGGLGYVLDAELGSKPWLLFLGLMLGMLSGFLGLMRDAQKNQENSTDKKDNIPPQ